MMVIGVAAAAACGGPRLAPTPAPLTTTRFGSTATPATRQDADGSAATAGLCANGRLLVGDLPGVDRSWQDGLAAATAKALDWQPDAALNALQVSCQLFETGFRWQATFYSRNAQAFFLSDTGDVKPAGVRAENVPLIGGEPLSFALLQRALAKSGFEDRTSINPSTGIEVRRNSASAPFGPPDAPKGAILYHVAIERLGEVKDVFVDGSDGKVYRYSR